MDDIVTRLRFFLYEAPERWDDRAKWHAWGHVADAADYIEQLQVAGDALARAMASGSDTGWDGAIDTWRDARQETKATDTQVLTDSLAVVTEDLVKQFPTMIDALREVARLQNVVSTLSESLSSLAQEKAFWERQAQND